MTNDVLKKAKQEQMIVAALLVVFVGVLFNSLRSSGMFGKRAGAPTPAARQAAARATPAAKAAQASAAQDAGASVTPMPSGEATYTAQDLRDPLMSLLPKKAKVGPESAGDELAAPAPVKPETPPVPSLEVQGLWLDGANAKAMIRGKLYGVGDTIEGVKITRIGRDGVSGEFYGAPVRFAVTMRESSNGRLAQPGQWR